MIKRLTLVLVAWLVLVLAPFAARAQGQLVGPTPHCGPGGDAQCFNMPIYPLGGIVGTISPATPSTSLVGAGFISDIPLGSAVPLTSGVAANVASIVLPTGDFDCHGVVSYSAGATTTGSHFSGGASVASAVIQQNGSNYSWPVSVPAGSPILSVNLGTASVIVTGPLTIFLVAQATFAISTESAYGQIACRRMR
jgi:hypothetical protein